MQAEQRGSSLIVTSAPAISHLIPEAAASLQVFSTSPRKTRKALLQSQLCSNAQALEEVAEQERKAVAYAADSLRHKVSPAQCTAYACMSMHAHASIMCFGRANQ